VALCSLCLKEKTLKDSHLIPKSIYKAVRNLYPQSSGGITFGSTKTNSINYTDKQIKQHLLCFDCEQRFSKYGENHVTPDCFRNKSQFNLLDKLNNIPSNLITNEHDWYVPEDNSDIISEAYLYFGASIFWRASAGKWSDGIENYHNALGNKYQEELRKYLLGTTNFPSNIFLAVYVDTDSEVIPLVQFPTVSKKNGYHHHIFYIPGIKFSLIVGNNVKSVKKFSDYLNSKVMFAKYSFTKHPDYQLYCETFRKIEPRGRLKSFQKIKAV